jgi:hypothetical protein
MITDASFFKNPAQHLNNIFINMSQQEKSNQPKYIKHKRRNNFPAIDSYYTSTGIDSSNSEDDAEDIIFQKQKKGKSKPKSIQVTVKADKSSEKGDSAQNERLKISTEIKVKRIEKNAPESDTKNKIVENTLDVNENIPGFILHVPFWGGSFYYEKQQIEVVNT